MFKNFKYINTLPYPIRHILSFEDPRGGGGGAPQGENLLFLLSGESVQKVRLFVQGEDKSTNKHQYIDMVEFRIYTLRLVLKWC